MSNSTAFDYVIDVKTNVVKMTQGKAFIGTAEPTADGNLRVTALNNGLNKALFKRAK